jgi:large subunit ribosomal protein L35
MAKKAKKQKLKSHRGAAKRFKITATGKVMRGAAFKRHILTSKTTKSKRHMRGSKEVTPGDARKIKLMLPYD